MPAPTRTNARTTTRSSTDNVRPITSAKKITASAELCHGLHAMRSELFGHALRLTRSQATAEDLVQDTVERAIRFQSSFQRGTNLRAWAHQILFSIFISRCRRRRLERTAIDTLTNAPGAWTQGEKSPETIALSPPVARALESLPQGFRAAVVLVDIEEMAYKDAATLLGVPLGTVMSRLHRGRAMLADRMLGVTDEVRAAA